MDLGAGWPRRCALEGTQALLVGGTLLGVGVVLYAVARAWRGQWVPPWLPTAGVLVILVAARRTFKGVTAASPPEVWIRHLEQAWTVGSVCVALGILMALAGLFGPKTARRSPAMVTTGLVVAAVGLVWASWTHGEAELWRAWGAPRVVLEGVRAAAEQRLRDTFFWTAFVLALAGTPALIWGLLRGRWVGVGETVAAGMLVVIVLGTGQPAREAVQAASAPWMTRCDDLDAVGIARPPGEVPWDGRPLVRIGPTGAERWRDGAWVDEPWPDGPIAVVAPPSLPASRLSAWLSGRDDVVLAGLASPPDAPRLFGRHPVVVASRCHATAWPGATAGEAAAPPAR